MRFLCALLSLAALALPAPARAETVTVFAAASLKNALDDVARQYEAASGNKVTVSYASSSTLAKQIENGAPAEVYLPADLEWMDYLAERRLVDGASRVNLLGNTLVLIAPAASKTVLEIKPGFALRLALGPGRLAMADPDHVPAGKYAKAALQSLSVWHTVERQLARAENVRAALAFVARGEAQLGIVYRTDALAEPKVKVIGEFPRSSHAPIVYPAALTTAARSPAAAALLKFLAAPAARSTWEKHGFAPVN